MVLIRIWKIEVSFNFLYVSVNIVSFYGINTTISVEAVAL